MTSINLLNQVFQPQVMGLVPGTAFPSKGGVLGVFEKKQKSDGKRENSMLEKFIRFLDTVKWFFIVKSIKKGNHNLVQEAKAFDIYCISGEDYIELVEEFPKLEKSLLLSIKEIKQELNRKNRNNLFLILEKYTLEGLLDTLEVVEQCVSILGKKMSDFENRFSFDDEFEVSTSEDDLNEIPTPYLKAELDTPAHVHQRTLPV